MGSIWSKLTHMGWVGLGWVELMWWVGLDWIEFFFTHYGGLGQKILLTRPNPTYAYSYCRDCNKWFLFVIFFSSQWKNLLLPSCVSMVTRKGTTVVSGEARI